MVMGHNKLFKGKMVVINVGLKLFEEGVRQQGVKTISVVWRPPVDKKLYKLLGKVM